MAAISIQEKLELMSDELAFLETNSIFSSEELQQIVQQRTEFESLIHGSAVNKLDWLRYIQYELNLETLRRKLTIAKGIEVVDTKTLDKIDQATSRRKAKNDMDYAKRVVHRLLNLFNRTLSMYPKYTALTLFFLEWVNSLPYSMALKAYTRALQLAPENAYAWAVAAEFEYAKNESFDNARSLFQRGLRFNKNCQALWLDYFRLELLYCHHLKKKLNSEQKQDEKIAKILNGELAFIIFSDATKGSKDLEFEVKFLANHNEFNRKVVQQVRNRIASSLLEKYSGDFESVDRIIRALYGELVGALDHIKTNAKKVRAGDESGGLDPKVKAEISKKALAGLQDVTLEMWANIAKQNPTKFEIWDYYLRFAVDCLHYINEEEKRKTVCTLFRECLGKNNEYAASISQRVYKTMVSFYLSPQSSDSDKEFGQNILLVGLKYHPNAPALWAEMLRHATGIKHVAAMESLKAALNNDNKTNITTDAKNHESILGLFQKAIDNCSNTEFAPSKLSEKQQGELSDDLMSLFIVILDYCAAHVDLQANVENFLRQAINSRVLQRLNKNNSSAWKLKAMLIDWMFLNAKQDFRKLCDELISSEKACKGEVISHCLRVEQAMIPVDIHRVRSLFQELVAVAGQTSYDGWLNWAEFEHSTDSQDANPELVYHNALLTLEPSCRNKFLACYKSKFGKPISSTNPGKQSVKASKRKAKATVDSKKGHNKKQKTHH